VKKLYSTPEWRFRTKQRQEAALVAAQRSRELRRHGDSLRDVRRRREKKPRGRVTIAAPTVFSMVRNAEEMSAFFFELFEENARRHHVFLDLSGVTDLTVDGVAVLLARVNAPGRTGVEVIGNIPADPRVLGLLVQTGFFEHVTPRQGRPPDTGQVSGKIYKKTSRVVEGEQARDLIHRVARGILGEPREAKGVYSTLIEIMGNTHEHAPGPGGTAGQESWWMTASIDPATKRATFAFVDEGVGIFRSVRLQRARHLLRSLGLTSNAAILRDMLRGEIEASSTGLQGLPVVALAIDFGVVTALSAGRSHADTRQRKTEDGQSRVRRLITAQRANWPRRGPGLLDARVSLFLGLLRLPLSYLALGPVGVDPLIEFIAHICPLDQLRPTEEDRRGKHLSAPRRVGSTRRLDLQ
jgi:hypothetical protein